MLLERGVWQVFKASKETETVVLEGTEGEIQIRGFFSTVLWHVRFFHQQHAYVCILSLQIQSRGINIKPNFDTL